MYSGRRHDFGSMQMHPETTAVAATSHFHTSARTVRLGWRLLSLMSFPIHHSSRLPSCGWLYDNEADKSIVTKTKNKDAVAYWGQSSSSLHQVQGILDSTYYTCEVMVYLTMAALFNYRDYSLRILPCDRSVASSKAICPVKCHLSAASFKFQYLLCSMRSASTCLCLLPRVLFPYSFLYYRVLFHILLHYYIHVVYKKLRITQTSNKFIKQLYSKLFSLQCIIILK